MTKMEAGYRRLHNGSFKHGKWLRTVMRRSDDMPGVSRIKAGECVE
jgi:hypothetical protein